MTAISWDRSGDRVYRIGLDRGVLFLQNGLVVPWNGLVSVDENSDVIRTAIYNDGVKIGENVTPSEYTATLKAFTYPDEFEDLHGTARRGSGLYVHDQKPQRFSLSYRTRVGNDLQGADFGYRIHIVYGVIATPDTVTVQTLGEQNQPTVFSWTLTGVPTISSEYQPAGHVSIDSRETDSEVLAELETYLYGGEESDPILPLLGDLLGMF